MAGDDGHGYTFPKSDRLSGRRAIEGLFARGEGGFVYPFRYVFVERPGSGAVASLVSVPKKLHKRAVGRNLLKRRMREALRTHNGELREIVAGQGKGVNLALMYVTKDVVDYDKIGDAVGKILSRIGARVGAEVGRAPGDR